MHVSGGKDMINEIPFTEMISKATETEAYAATVDSDMFYVEGVH